MRCWFKAWRYHKNLKWKVNRNQHCDLWDSLSPTKNMALIVVRTHILQEGPCRKHALCLRSELFIKVCLTFQELLGIYKTQRIILLYITTDVISAAPPVSAALQAAGSLCGHPMLQCAAVPGWLLSPVTTTMAIVKRIKKYFKDPENISWKYWLGEK